MSQGTDLVQRELRELILTNEDIGTWSNKTWMFWGPKYEFLQYFSSHKSDVDDVLLLYRSDKAGKMLAEVLLKGLQGHRSTY